jgi:hypothetical protein
VTRVPDDDFAVRQRRETTIPAPLHSAGAQVKRKVREQLQMNVHMIIATTALRLARIPIPASSQVNRRIN